MFIKINNVEQEDELKVIYAQIKEQFGEVPSNFELIGSIDVNILKDFLSYSAKLSSYKNINNDYFTFLRLFIANQEEFKYCLKFNSKLLQSRGYTDVVINSSKIDLAELPFCEKHKLLAMKSIKAIFNSENFNQSDFNELYKVGWNDKEIFYSIEHVGFMLRNGRILRAYSMK